MSQPSTLSFDKHSYEVTVKDVVQAKVTDLALLPEKRTRPDGKAYTPPLVAIVCDVGTLLFVLEDITTISGLMGPVIKLADFGSITFQRKQVTA